MLTAFTAGLLLITISELGDKTFCIAMILAMRHSRRLVFIGVVAALAAMTALSVLMGQAVSFLPKTYIWYAEISLFIGFGLKLLYDAYRMPVCPACDDIEEAKETIEQAGLMDSGAGVNYSVVVQAFLLTFVAEWGDRTQFATIALAASNNPWGVTIGATLGHAVCAAIAVVGGRLVAGRISERVVTALGGGLFIIFGIAAAIQGK
ncbi:MAG: TMEM165/GDT1 family protein [Oscillatoriales cyanobacterium C42_A2020_001]|nr:TMEM165/GDT1 family protein [Leptolyngbyaceae cyanobacterium C42_A2020_001]